MKLILKLVSCILSGNLMGQRGHLTMSREIWGLSSVSKESACNAGDPGLIPGSGRSPGKGHGNPFLYSCLEHSMDRGVWRVIVRGVTKSQALLSD